MREVRALAPSRARLLLGSALLLAAVAFAPALGNGFVWDDGQYLLGNRHVATGFSPENLRWALTSLRYSNWHPLTWISHQLDVELFGLRPGGHHLVSLLVHLANTALMFAALRALTGAAGRSAAVAALFAVHPLRVESVAWVAERKDLLSAFFGLAAVLAYAREVRRPGWPRRLAVVACFAAALAAKPMLVTLPFVLLLLDWWPLGRLNGARGPGAALAAVGALLREKAHLFALAAGSCALTLLAQRRGGALGDLEQLPLAGRAANAAVSCLAYLRSAAWPFDLAAFYPHPRGGVSPAAALAAAFALAAATAGVLAARRRLPFLAAGWLWYLGTLVPVIGLVQVGGQARADRYTYLPLTGVLIALVWWSAAGAGRGRKGAAAALAASVLAPALAAATFAQARAWRSEETLFSGALRATDGNYLAHNNLALALHRQGRTREALEHLAQALRINPAYAEAHQNLGVALQLDGRDAEALGHFEAALRARPAFPAAHVAAALSLARLGRSAEARVQFSEALRDDPEFSEGHLNLANFLEEAGDFDDAVRHYLEAQRLDPRNEVAFFDFGVSLEKRGRREEAAAQYRQALRLKPDFPEARERLALVGRPPGR